MSSLAELRAELARARENTLAANRAYKAAWRKTPGPRGYPAVDRALEALHQAEHHEASLTRQLAECAQCAA